MKLFIISYENYGFSMLPCSMDKGNILGKYMPARMIKECLYQLCSTEVPLL